MGQNIRIDYVGAVPPAYATADASGADLYAALEQVYILKPLERVLISTGLKLAIPAGYEGQVRSRSGLALQHGIMVLNSPGTIDSDYRGEIKILLINLGEKEFAIEPGQRIAQLVIVPTIHATFNSVSELPDTVRGSGGFGSTGRQ